MQAADTPRVEGAIQRALANESWTELEITTSWGHPPLTAVDAQRIMVCLKNPRFHALAIRFYDIHDPAVLNVFRNGLPLCTAVTTVKLQYAHLGNEGLERLLSSFYNTSITELDINDNNIHGQRGGELIQDLMHGNNTLLKFNINTNPIGPQGSIRIGRGLAGNHRLQSVNLESCGIGNEGLANLLPADGMINNSLTDLNLALNNIDGAEGGRQVSLLLQRFPALKVLSLHGNRFLGPIGARALALGLATSHLESLDLHTCWLGNDGVTNLIPDGQENRSLTNLNMDDNNIEGAEGGRQVTLLLQRFPALKVLSLCFNRLLGPIGARALAPGIAAACHLKELYLYSCLLRNDSVDNLIPDGQVNRSLTNLNLQWNKIEGLEGGENIVALASRCTNLDRIDVTGNDISPDQQRRLGLLLDRKRLCTEALALGGSPFPVLFRFVEKAPVMNTA